MELTQTNKERLVQLVNKAIELYHELNADDTRNFMYSYYVSDQGSLVCIHNIVPEKPIIMSTDINNISKDLAMLGYYLTDLVDDELARLRTDLTDY